MGEKGIIIALKRIPPDKNVRECALNPPLNDAKVRQQLPRPRPAPERRPGTGLPQRINGLTPYDVVCRSPVETKPNGIDQGGAENVVFFQSRKLPLCDDCRYQDIVQAVGRREWSVVEHVGPEQTVLLRKFVVDSEW